MENLFPFLVPSGCPRWFFCDMNAFYASVEQQECERYRGKPVIVVPVLCDHTCAIAASYEAKKHGIRTGSSVALAKAAAPELQIVEARPELYLAYHARLLDVLNRHFATIRVLSVDEMACRIPALLYKTAHDEARLAARVKADICGELGEYVRCSVGIAPNVFLAKVASDRQKPDGLTIWNEENLPDALFDLKLTDLPGIGSAMKRRLNEYGITTVQMLWEASPADLRRVWHSVLGERWYYMLRGSQEPDTLLSQRNKRRRQGKKRLKFALLAAFISLPDIRAGNSRPQRECTRSRVPKQRRGIAPLRKAREGRSLLCEIIFCPLSSWPLLAQPRTARQP